MERPNTIENEYLPRLVLALALKSTGARTPSCCTADEVAFDPLEQDGQ